MYSIGLWNNSKGRLYIANYLIYYCSIIESFDMFHKQFEYIQPFEKSFHISVVFVWFVRKVAVEDLS